MHYPCFENTKLNLIVGKIVLESWHFLEILISFEAFVKSRQEFFYNFLLNFLENLLEIDNTLMQNFNIDLKMHQLKKSTVKRMIAWMCTIVIYYILTLFVHYKYAIFPLDIFWNSFEFCCIADIFPIYHFGEFSSVPSAHCESTDEWIEIWT